jgi:hypothetical protein
MSDDNKTEEFLQKLMPYIERRELEKYVGKVVHVTRKFIL